jgi:prepilin-type N-terminal cleavage/methylation domain-containing protein/prepilin-type processing-associated H-X9-DG protein
MRPAARQSRHAFTLVELLVVIGIIAVLISILLPVLGRVRESGNRTKCLSNLRELGIAMRQYASTHNDRLPNGNPAGFFSPSGEDLSEVLVEFASRSVKLPKLFHCPSDVQPEPNKIDNAYPDTENSARMSYEFFSLWWDSADGPRLVKLKMAPLAWDFNGGDPVRSASQNHGTEGGNVVYADGHADWQIRKRWDGPNWPNPANSVYPYTPP